MLFRSQGTSVYATTMKELNGTLIKQRQSAKVFANDTLFTPILLQSLCQKFESIRWYQLYLIKILHKKPLIGRIRVLFSLYDKLKSAKTEYKFAFKLFIEAKYKRLKQQRKVKNTNAFLCGNSSTKYARKKAIEEPKIDLASIQELSLKATMSYDKLERLREKMAFEIIKFEYIVKRERNTYLNLIFNNEAKVLYHLYMGALIHYTKVKKEKRELISLTQEKICNVFMMYVLNAWRNYKSIKDERLRRVEIVKKKYEERLYEKVLRGLKVFKMMKGRKRLLGKTVNEYIKAKLMAKSFYFFRYFKDYNKKIKERIKNPIYDKKTPIVDRMGMEKLYKAQIMKVKNKILSRATNVLKRKFKLIKEKSKKDLKVLSKPMTNTEIVHANLYKYQVQNNIYRNSIKLIKNSMNIEQLRKHAMQLIGKVRMLKKSKSKGCIFLQKIFSSWRFECIINLLQKDVSIISRIPICRNILKALHENYIISKDRENEAQKEHNLKFAYSLLKKWNQYSNTMNIEREKQIISFTKKRFINHWKKYISFKIDKYNKKIKAVEYYRYKRKYLYLHQLLKILRNKENINVFYMKSTISKLFKRWKQKCKNRPFLKRLFRDIILYYPERMKSMKHETIFKALKKWKAVTIDDPEFKYERKLFLPARNHYKQRLLSKTIFNWGKLTRIYRGFNKLSNIFCEKTLRPCYTKWINETEFCLEKILRIRKNYANRLLMKTFGSLKREFLLSKLSKLFRIQKIMNGWFKQLKKNPLVNPINHYKSVLENKCFSGFRNNIKSELMKKKRAIIGHEMEAKYNHKLKKTSFVSILEYIMTKKKKSMILKTIDEFHEICLLKKSLAGIIKYANQRQKKHININKALHQYIKVKRNREELKKMIDEFNIKEYGSDRVICINQ